MVFRYPNGKRYRPAETRQKRSPQLKSNSYSNRGMTLEEDINETNQYYLDSGRAVIHKKPTPVQIVNVDYPKRSAAVIKEAYFKQPSTTDYNGLYQGRYIDFEAKETRSKTSFPLKNFHEHQINHMQQITMHHGICFVLLRFSAIDEIYLLQAEQLLGYWKRMKDGGRKSITKEEIEVHAHRIPIGFQPRIDYLTVIDKIYLETSAER
ncbi:Holliday junction resolvase RecU [Bacillus tianshenii]|nr:Holliday junction resolvase RecU [Bacillus tianshenii]